MNVETCVANPKQTQSWPWSCFSYGCHYEKMVWGHLTTAWLAGTSWLLPPAHLVSVGSAGHIQHIPIFSHWCHLCNSMLSGDRQYLPRTIFCHHFKTVSLHAKLNPFCAFTILFHWISFTHIIVQYKEMCEELRISVFITSVCPTFSRL